MRVADILQNPLGGRRLGSGASVAAILVSVPVNAWFQKASFVGLVGWLERTAAGSLTESTAERLAEAQAGMAFSLASRLPYGLLMTAFVLAFLLPACKVGHGRTWREGFECACGALPVPVALLAVASPCMETSLAVGMAFAVAALAACVATIVLETRGGGWNGWLTVAWVTGFVLITAVMLTRNHVVTMFG